MSIADKLTQIAENEQAVFEAGKAEGAKEEYDRFWDVYQENGNRTNYENAFYNKAKCWTKETLKPKYNLNNIKSAQYMFYAINFITNLDEWASDNGITIDFEKADNISYAFCLSSIVSVGVINISNCLYASCLFQYCSGLKTIGKLILSGTISTTFPHAFDRCPALENITIEGTIGNDISFSDSALLTKSSITSVINALSDTEVGKTATFSQVAKESAFTAEEWATLIGTKPNWTISLV